MHSRVLRLATKRSRRVRQHNMYVRNLTPRSVVRWLIHALSSTSARPLPGLVPRNRSGEALESKHVDFSLNLDNPVGSHSIEDRIKDLLSIQAAGLQTVNTTTYGPVIFQPCAVSVETKLVSGSEVDARGADRALGFAAWFRRISILL